MIVRSNELNILGKLLESGKQISTKDRRAILRNGAIYTEYIMPKRWAEIMKRFPLKLITAIIIPKIEGKEDLWKLAASTYLYINGLYYNEKNCTKTADSQDLIDISFKEYPETYDAENHYSERETLIDLTGHTTVIHLGEERNNKLFPEIANSLTSQFRSNPTSKCLLWIFEGTKAEYNAKYSEIEVDQIIDIGRPSIPGKVETKKVIAENNKTQNNTEMWWERI
jgi:hypothetical protein